MRELRSLPSVRLLVVDDDETYRRAVREALVRLPFDVQVVEAADGASALDAVRGAEIDVVLLDFDLPGRTGDEVADAIRRVAPNVPIVLCTASNDANVVESAMRAGVVDFLPKSALVSDHLGRVIRHARRTAAAERAARLANEELERHAAQLAQLLEASMRIHGAESVADVARVAAECARDVLGADATVEIETSGERHSHRAVDPRTPAQAADVRELEIPMPNAAGPPHGVLRLARRGAPWSRSEPLLAAQIARAAQMAAERRSLVEIAQASARNREEVILIVSHDLRVPLQAFSLGLEALRPLVADSPGGPELIARLGRGVTAMARLLGDLLDVARIQDSRLSLELEEHDPAQILVEVGEQMRPIAQSKGLALVVEPAKLAPIVCDSRRIAQAVSNFSANAIRHTASGHILLRARENAGAVRLEVEDTGPGVPADVRDRIFDRLYQDARGAHRGGLGLGLYIAKGIADAHGGRVGVESKPGQGSTFFLEVPRGRPAG